MLKLLILSGLAVALMAQGVAEEPDCPVLDCDLTCEDGLQQDKDGCDVCECKASECQGVDCDPGLVCKAFQLTSLGKAITDCVDPELPAACQQPKDAGPCEALEESWYFVQKLGICERFDYGGCKGNDNHFSNREACLHACNPDALDTCKPMICFMECPAGFEHDAEGCDVCECAKPKCADMKRCRMHCPSGFLQDAQGCDMCECVEPESEPEMEMMLEAEPECVDMKHCRMHCPSGFKRDAQGCAVCECNECALTECFMQCEHGRLRDEHGCEVCECLEEAEGQCPPKQCHHECVHGFRTDQNGCRTCRCKENPCHLVECEHGTVCKLVDNQPTCDAQATPELFGCSAVTCMMHCEHGFQTDQYGCEVCACHEEAPAPCTLQQCTTPCLYGNQHDQHGCPTCTCLDNPCTSEDCGDTHVCETLRDPDCPHCRAISQCTQPHEIQRVVVELEFFHEPVDNIDLMAVESELMRTLVEMLEVEQENIRGLQASGRTDNTLTVVFHVVDVEEVVLLYHSFKQDVDTSRGPVLRVAETEFIPEHESLRVEYSTRSGLPGQRGPVEDGGLDDTTMYIIIGCAVGGVALITIIVVAALMVTRKSSKPKQKNVIYKKAPSHEEEA